jgi:hypothetical protein
LQDFQRGFEYGFGDDRDPLNSFFSSDESTNNVTDIHRWDKILEALHYRAVAPIAISPPFSATKPDGVRIVILDRPSSDTVLVSWSSSTVCRYGEQLWKRGVSRKSGICALSGDSIVRGDAIFRPRRERNAMCSNATAMIRAGAIEREQLPPGLSVDE